MRLRAEKDRSASTLVTAIVRAICVRWYSVLYAGWQE